MYNIHQITGLPAISQDCGKVDTCGLSTGMPHPLDILGHTPNI